MSCSKIDSGRTFEQLCESGGFKYFYAANFTDVVPSGFTYSGDKISGMTMSGTSSLFYKFEVDKETIEFTYKGTRQGGSVGYSGEFKAVFYGNNTSNFIGSDDLLRNRAIIVAVDVNDRCWVLGKKLGADVSTLDINFGKTIDDGAAGQMFTWTIKEPERLYELTNETVVSSLT